MTTDRRILAFGLWLLPVLVMPIIAQQPTPLSGAEPITTILCDVVAHPEKFAGKRVSFRASFVSDGLEHSSLRHSSCKLGIVPGSSVLGALSKGQVEEVLLSTSLSDLRGEDEEQVSGRIDATSRTDDSARVSETILAQARHTGARLRLIEDGTLLAPVGGVVASLRYRT